MADLIFNIAKGRLVQFARNVEDGTPSTSRLILIPFHSDGSSTDDNVRDADTVAAVEALTGITERTANGWNRKTLAAADLTITTDDTNNRQDVDIINDQTWTPTNASDTVTDLCLAYDADTGSGTDSDLIPIAWYDFAITPDGTLVTAQINSAGAYRSS